VILYTLYFAFKKVFGAFTVSKLLAMLALGQLCSIHLPINVHSEIKYNTCILFLCIAFIIFCMWTILD